MPLRPARIFSESVWATLLRFAVYAVTVFLCALSLPAVIHYGDISIFYENGPIERLQLFILALTSALFLTGRRLMPRMGELFLLLALISAFAAVRELDMLLDNLVPFLGWKIGTLVLIFAAWMSYTRRDVLKPQIEIFLASRAFALLFSGFLVAVPFAQLVGHGAFLELLMGDDYVGDYKRVIEEFGELVGYILLLTGAVESLVQMRQLSEANADR